MRYLQCCLCPSIIDTYKQNCGYELYSKEVNIPGFNNNIKTKLRADKVWFHLDCYYNLRLRKWGGEEPPRINGEPCIVRSESKLLPVSINAKEQLINPQTETKISEILETDSITIVNRPLIVKDADSVSMSRYFEDVTMKEVEHVSDKAVYAIRKRFASMVQNQHEERNQNQSENVKENDNDNRQMAKVYIGNEDGEQEEITRNVKQIEGVDSNGKIILKEVLEDVGEE